MPLVNWEDFLKARLDYIIVGGGTAGLVLAARLSEDPSVNVGVIEAGASYLGNIDVDTPGPIGRALATPAADFSLKTCPQVNCFQQEVVLPRGRALGGSSAVNFSAMNRACSKEYDAIEALGNPGWNWTEMLRCFRKTEKLQTSTTSLETSLGVKVKPDTHGDSGPLGLTFPEWYPDLRQPYIDALSAVGLRNNPDPAAGYNIGHNLGRYYISSDGKRSYSASAYYGPASHRENLLVLCEATATKLELIETYNDGRGLVRAAGVHFDHQGKKLYAEVAREVILSAGSICSPQLLELSGVGSPVILAKQGIQSVVDLPGVGENLQDHPAVPVDFQIKPEFQTVESMQDISVAEEHARMLSEKLGGFYSSPNVTAAFLGLEDIANENETRHLLQMLEVEILKRSSSEAISRRAQDTLLKVSQTDPDIPHIELIYCPGLVPGAKRSPEPNTLYCSIICILLKPASRGSVHIQSPESSVQPRIDPAYLSLPSELEVLKLGVRKILQMSETESWKKVMLRSLVKDDLEQIQNDNPGLDETGVLEVYCRERAAGTTFHLLGSAAMLPRENGGVVDSRLKVYGTENLRVVDASVIPMELSCHISSTIYAIAEKAAEMIKEDRGALREEIGTPTDTTVEETLARLSRPKSSIGCDHRMSHISPDVGGSWNRLIRQIVSTWRNVMRGGFNLAQIVKGIRFKGDVSMNAVVHADRQR